MSLSRRRTSQTVDQPVLPLDVGDATPAASRRGRSRSRPKEQAPVQLALDGFEKEEPELDCGLADVSDSFSSLGQPEPPTAEHSAIDLPVAELPVPVAELPDFDPDPFAEIPGFTPTAPATAEYLLLPGSLKGRLDLREFARFLAALPTVARDWEGAPEVEDGGVRLRGAEGGAWVYPEAKRVRLVVDGAAKGAVGEDLVALCRWLEARAGMLLYPEGESTTGGADRSLDPWETFLGA